MNQKQLPEEHDDFQKLDGIGPAMERRLVEAGIRSYGQLTAVSAQELATLLPGITAEKIEQNNWHGKAQTLAQAQAATASGNGQHYATFTVKLLLNKDNSVRRTHITHVQQEEHKETWAGWQPKRVQSFIRQHAQIGGKQPPAKAQTAAAASTIPFGKAAASPSFDLRIEPIDELTMHFVESSPASSAETAASTDSEQSVLSQKPSQSTQPESAPEPLSVELNTPNNLLEHGHAFNVQLFLDLARLAHDKQTPLNYQAAIYAARLDGGTRQKVGSAYGAINTVAKTVAIDVPSQIALPGTYRLEAEMAIAFIPAMPDLTTNSKGGLLHVY